MTVRSSARRSPLVRRLGLVRRLLRPLEAILELPEEEIRVRRPAADHLEELEAGGALLLARLDLYVRSAVAPGEAEQPDADGGRLVAHPGLDLVSPPQRLGKAGAIHRHVAIGAVAPPLDVDARPLARRHVLDVRVPLREP